METLALVFALLTIYLGLIQVADVAANAYYEADHTGNIAILFFFLAIVFAVLAVVGV